jgi:hypothetical protein
LYDFRLTIRQIVLQCGPDIKERQTGVGKTCIEGNKFVEHRVFEWSRDHGVKVKIIRCQLSTVSKKRNINEF